MTTTTTPTWTPDPAGLVPDDAISERQIGVGLTIRYTPGSEPADGLHAQITSSWAVVEVEHPDGSAVFDLENVTEYLIGTDPHDLPGTEVWSNTETETPHWRTYPTAEDAALALATVAAAREQADAYVWDGRTRC